jgi:hypothetical protein
MSRVAGLAARTLLAAGLACLGSCGRERPAPSKPARPRVSPLPPEAFRLEWKAHTIPSVMKAGARERVSVTVRNSSAVTWPAPSSTGRQPPQQGAVRLGYRWWSVSSPTAVAEPVARADFDRSVPAGKSATVGIVVTAPTAPGDYTLQLDLLQELVAWFEPQGADQLLVPVQVRQ